MASPKQMVFLVGPPRSGSTWLQTMLGNHPDIGTAQESHLFNHFFTPLFESWDNLLAFQDGRGGIGLPAYLTQTEFDSLLRNFADGVFNNIPESAHPVFLEKTPDHIRHIDQIMRLYPEAKIIVLLRKPEDVIESLLNAGGSWGQSWAPKSTIRALRQYLYFFKKYEKTIGKQPPGTVHKVHYESLKKNPQKVVSGILSFLDLSHSDSLVNTMVKQPLILKKHGEFGKQTGNNVMEPEGFARKKKGTLTLWQRCMVNIALWQHKRVLGY